MRKNNFVSNVDLILVILYFLILGFGWIALYSAETSQNSFQLISLNTRPGKQIIWIVVSIIIVIILQFLDYRFYLNFALPIYILSIIFLLTVLFFGVSVAGSKSWVELFGLRIQPSEFAKFSTALLFTQLLSIRKFNLLHFKNVFIIFFVVISPFLLILLQGDFGTALIFSSFIIVLYRDGGISTRLLVILIGLFTVFILGITINSITLTVIIILISLFGIGLSITNQKQIINIIIIAVCALFVIRGEKFLLNNVIKSHHKERIISVLNPNTDPLGVGWSVNQSKIAIGSGGAFGNGYLQGTQTRFNFVPKQSTDFIFSVIGEEFGFMGSVFFIILYSFFLIRILIVAETQKDKFAMLYGYSVFSLFFVHYSLNIAMSMGLFPVIGIPLPFVSYGGSSIISFSILFFVFLKFNSYQTNILRR